MLGQGRGLRLRLQSHCGYQWVKTLCKDHRKAESQKSRTTNQAPSIKPLIGLLQAAKVLNCHPLTVSRMAQRRELPAVKIGNRWKFRASALDRWINDKLTSHCPESKQGG
ncbi:MAG TPA: helix-turn-helix domain-containing protein [Candidatus Angelobacter sp.]|nr:helix-turn-helix domain-containing protein [Candidatus Angelobacter sp.]